MWLTGIVSRAADVLWMSVVRGMRGIGGVCEMCMCLARDGEGGDGVEWMKGLVWVLPILWEHGECWTCVFFVRWCGW